MFVLSAAPINSISTPSVESSPPGEHDPAANSIQQLHNLQNHISHLWLPRRLLSLLLSIFETYISAPRQYDTDNAISNVITFEICSLLPPYASMLRQQLDIRIAVGGLSGHTHPGPA